MSFRSIPRPHALLVASLLMGALPAAARPQSASPPKAHPPSAEGGRSSADKTHTLDALFGALKVAPDDAVARAIEGRIWAIWASTPSDTAALLSARAKVAMESQKLDVALELLDAVVKLRPDYIEGWNRRATVYYLKNDYGHSLEDIRQVLVREPRHFGALAGLGMIMQELGDEKRALQAFRQALAVNPRLEKVPDLVKTLTEKVEGRDI